MELLRPATDSRDPLFTTSGRYERPWSGREPWPEEGSPYLKIGRQKVRPRHCRQTRLSRFHRRDRTHFEVSDDPREQTGIRENTA